jgi:hypothetical protein
MRIWKTTSVWKSVRVQKSAGVRKSIRVRKSTRVRKSARVRKTARSQGSRRLAAYKSQEGGDKRVTPKDGLFHNLEEIGREERFSFIGSKPGA